MRALKMHSFTPGSEEEASWQTVTSGWTLKIISSLKVPSSKNHHPDTQELEFSLTLHARFFFLSEGDAVRGFQVNMKEAWRCKWTV